MTYQPKTNQFTHQRTVLDATWDKPGYALFWEQGCVDAQTEYLSPQGWRPIGQYAGGQVAQWWPDGCAEFVEPSAYIKAPCDQMFHIQHKYGVDQMLSPEHRMALLTKQNKNPFVNSAENVARELRASESAFRALPATFHIKRNGNIGLGLSENDLRLQIAVMADGSFPKHSPRTRRCLVHIKKPYKIERLRALLSERANVYERPAYQPGFVNFSFNAPIRCKTFGDKFWRNASADDMRIVADEVFRWDGSEALRTYRSMHEADADFVQLALGYQGLSASKTYSKCWVVRVRESFFCIKASNFKEVRPSDGLKYCFTVPSSFLVFRRNGCIFPSGNTGKTKGLIDNAARLFEAGAINGLFVIAPNVLHRNFIEKELPKHLPDRIDRVADYYMTDKAGTRKHDERMMRLLTKTPGVLPVLAMSYDSILTDLGKGVANAFLTTHRCLYGLDESARIKEPTSLRTIKILKSAKFAPFRRVMTGTPVSQAPWDLFTQVKFCDDDFWKPHGLDDIKAMRTAFGIWETGRRRVNIAQAYGKNGGLKYGYVVNNGAAFMEFPTQTRDDSGRKLYKDLGRLRTIIEPIRSRVLKSEVFDLPPKIYTRLDFELASDQARAYEQMTKLGFAILEDGDVATSKLALNTIMKLQQITSGWLPADATLDDPDILRIKHFKKNPKLDLLGEIVDDMDVQCLIWARFRADIDLICKLLTSKGKFFARYDGFVDQDERFDGDERFHRGDAQFSVGTPECGGEGRTLTEAKTVVHYSNNFKLNDRLQAEDRAHRWGQDNAVNYIDLVARGTVDEHILETLQSKLDVASAVTGDKFRHWLSVPGKLL